MGVLLRSTATVQEPAFLGVPVLWLSAIDGMFAGAPRTCPAPRFAGAYPSRRGIKEPSWHTEQRTVRAARFVGGTATQRHARQADPAEGAADNAAGARGVRRKRHVSREITAHVA